VRLRSALRDFFPAALTAFSDLDAPDALELLRRAPDPDQAARLSGSTISAVLRRARRRDIDDKAAQLQAVLRSDQLRQPALIQAAYAAIVTSEVAITEALTTQIDRLGQVRRGQAVDILFDVTNPGLWMAHCHIAEHMHSGMMFSFTVGRDHDPAR
jgi:hypothetical protein